MALSKTNSKRIHQPSVSLAFVKYENVLIFLGRKVFKFTKERPLFSERFQSAYITARLLLFHEQMTGRVRLIQ